MQRPLPRIIVPQNARSDLQTLARAQCTPASAGVAHPHRLEGHRIPTPRPMSDRSRPGLLPPHCGQVGDGVTMTWASQAYKMPRARGDRAPLLHHAAFGSSRVASALPQQQERTASRAGRWRRSWRRCSKTFHTDAISRSASGASCTTSDLKPHKSEIPGLIVMTSTSSPKPTRFANSTSRPGILSTGRCVICCDEKNRACKLLERKAPTKPATTWETRRREHETFVTVPGCDQPLAVATGQLAWTIGPPERQLTLLISSRLTKACEDAAFMIGSWNNFE